MWGAAAGMPLAVRQRPVGLGRFAATADAVDEAEIDRAGRAAVRRIVGKQREAGIDVGNNGEQQRDSFFLYLKARLSGLGGSWERPSRADVDRYPEFKRMWAEQHVSKTQVSALGGLPKAIAPSTRSAAISEPYSTRRPAPSSSLERALPGILAMAVRNEYYDTLEAYLAALDAAAFVPHGRAAPRTHGQRSKPA